MAMPALLTHDYFGEDIWARMRDQDFSCSGKTSALVEELRRAFLLGNQGPDPFFYTLRSFRLAKNKKFGSLMHRERAAETLEVFRRLASRAPEPAASLIWAYLLGFLCHFTLDSIMHPFVYAQQYALCDAGVEGLDWRDGSALHGYIEATLDMMLLRRRRGVGISEYNYTKDVLEAGAETLTLLDAAYRVLACEVYAVDLPFGAFSRGVKDMRLTIKALYSPRGIKRQLIGRAECLFARHSFAQAMSPRADVGTVCDFDNREHATWANPFTRKPHTASFDELYATARKAAYENIAALRAGAPAAPITRSLNFEGAPINARL
jgi:hypothetical protein